MKMRFGVTILAAALLALLALPLAATAGGGGAGKGRMGGDAIRTRTQAENRFQNREMSQDAQRLRKGQEAESASLSVTGDEGKGGHVYGPGDGTGNVSNGLEPPQDGTGYGTPANR